MLRVDPPRAKPMIMRASYHARSPRSARDLGGIILLLASTAASCGPPAEPQTPPEEPPPPEPSVPQTRLFESSRSLPVVFGPIETREHFGEHLVGELRMSASARAPYLEGRPLPEGTRLALLLNSPGRSPQEEPRRVLWMEKHDGAWRFEAEPGGAGATPGGSPSLDGSTCARCHGEAPQDSVFRIRHLTGNAPGG